MRPRDRSVLRYVIEKGYITLDGASLTVTAVEDGEDGWWEIMLIAYSQEKVVMGKKREGQDVNVEVDMVGKYVDKSVAAYFESRTGEGPQVIERMVRKLVDERVSSMLKRL